MINEICICGGGPSGLAAAIALRQAGYSTSLYDTAVPPIDKACGEGLLPDGITALEELGVHLPADAGMPFEGIRFHNAGRVAQARFRGSPGIGIRRTVLHSCLVKRATELGVCMHWGSGAIKRPGAYDLLVGADGVRSAVRRDSGLDCAPGASRFGFRQHFQASPFSSFVDVFWRGRAQIYVTPLAANEIGVSVISADPHYRLNRALRDFPEVQERLHGAKTLSSERGSLSTMRRLRCIHKENVVLIGDASGSVDAITGEGMCLSFRQALALAKALQRGNLAEYGRAHDRITKRARLMARVLLTLGDHNLIRRPAIAGLSHLPALFSSLLSFHVGS